MIVTASSILKAVAVFIVGGSLMALLYYILDTPGRKRRRAASQGD